MLRPLHHGDREFLPAAIEILDSPPSPVAVSFIWLISAMFAAAIGWSYLAKVDIYAIARGKVEVFGRSKVVQPLEPGRIAAIFVNDGAVVKKGDILIQLDSTAASADEKRLADELMTAKAEVARRKAAIAAARLGATALPPIDFEPVTSQSIRLRERNVLTADLAQLNAALRTLSAQAAQQHAAERRLHDSIAEREKLLALSTELVQMREKLEKKGASSRALIIQARTRYETQLTTQISDKGQLKEAIAMLAATQRKSTETRDRFITDQTQKLAEIEGECDQLQQELVKAQSKKSQMAIRAPISGIVQHLAVTTIGQVVTGGQVLLTIVPRDPPLQIQALISNKDIGFVHVGQSAIVKIDAFPFSRYGTIHGSITYVSSDAIDMRNAPNLSDASAVTRTPSVATSSARSEPTLMFPATINPASHTINIDGHDEALMPGMTVTVEIETGKRRIIDYMLSPLRAMVSTAGHER